ncbi:MAG: synthase subunit b [Geminicoccaceae bacterium]|jgi:F-type H+-transporting ATPase subunit b|nr:synthase subunit b [Geminicoccaceae bacterium]
MRSFAISLAASLVTAAPLVAQEAGAHEPVNLLSPNTGLMFWTLLIFIVLLVILSRFAFKPLTAAVEARERKLEEAIKAAQDDRDKAATYLDEQRQAVETARADAQRMLADARSTGEKLRAEMLEQTKHQQHELLERARAEIDNERKRAIADLRREAVELALAGASKVIERNLDDQTNRKLVESFLATVPSARGQG